MVRLTIFENKYKCYSISHLYSAMKYKNGLFIFHRDLRIVDNKALLLASKSCERLYTCFVFTPEQVKKNQYKSTNSIEFMMESLEDLQTELQENQGKLILMYNHMVPSLKHLINELQIECLFFNEDYTPYAKQRTKEVFQMCEKEKIHCETEHDYCIAKPGSVLSQSGTTYMRFNAFYEALFFQHEFIAPNKKAIPNFAKTSKGLSHTLTLQEAFDKFVKTKNPLLAVHGGRTLGKSLLRKAVGRLENYGESRDDMSKQTSMMSAYIKFGCVSIREVVSAFKTRFSANHEYIRQLIWRDFYMHLLDAYPESLGSLHNKKMDSIRWIKNTKQLQRWKDGNTGFPLVDAGMRQMNATGYMHNRARMMVATFLTKILYIDWREGEKYFAQQLVDYDVASNSGNWQAIVGGGLYSMPWFRVMSPWAQSEKNDKDVSYIRTWVPELKGVPDKHIHKWFKYCKNYKEIDYPEPMVDYDKHRTLYMETMKTALQ